MISEKERGSKYKGEGLWPETVGRMLCNGQRFEGDVIVNTILRHLFVKTGGKLAEKGAGFREKNREMIIGSLKERYESI